MDAAKMGDSHRGCEGSPAFLLFWSISYWGRLLKSWASSGRQWQSLWRLSWPGAFRERYQLRH